MAEDEAKAQTKSRGRREKRRAAEPDVRVVEAVSAPVTEKRPAKPRARGRALAAPAAAVAPAMSDREAVLAANAHFYRAFELRDAAAMAATWAKVPYARCIHPGWEPLCGWDEIVGSWGQLFKTTEPMRFELADVVVRVGGSLAWVDLSEIVEAMHEGKPARTQVLATNLFERQSDGEWRMIHHHASPVMVRQPAPRRGGEPLH